jgi:hypothetical protein
MNMENLNERAANYAAEKANELLAKAIAQAYEDGYRDGYKDRAEKIDCAIDNTDIEYVDLGLPSGTRWSKEYLKDEKGFAAYYSYDDVKRLGLPSREQVEELISKCRWKGSYSTTGQTFYDATCKGKNSNEILVQCEGIMEFDDVRYSTRYGGGRAYFWIIDDSDDDEKSAVCIYGVEKEKPKMEIEKIFSGYKLPVLLVRKK